MGKESGTPTEWGAEKTSRTKQKKNQHGEGAALWDGPAEDNWEQIQLKGGKTTGERHIATRQKINQPGPSWEKTRAQ